MLLLLLTLFAVGCCSDTVADFTDFLEGEKVLSEVIGDNYNLLADAPCEGKELDAEATLSVTQVVQLHSRVRSHIRLDPLVECYK